MSKGSLITIALCAVLFVVLATCATTDADKTPVADFADYQSWTKINTATITGDVTAMLGSAHEGTKGFREVYVNGAGEAVALGSASYPFPAGTIVVNISLDDLLPEVILKADKVIVDDWHLVRNDNRRLIGKMYRERLINGLDTYEQSSGHGQRAIDAELGEIIIGKKPGRLDEEEIIVVNPFGLSIEDIGLALKVYRESKKIGLGIYLNR